MRASGTTLGAGDAPLPPALSSRTSVAEGDVGVDLEFSMEFTPQTRANRHCKSVDPTQVSRQASRIGSYPPVKYLMILVGPGLSQHAIPERSVHAGTSGSGLFARDKSTCPEQVPMGRPRIAHDPAILSEVHLLVNSRFAAPSGAGNPEYGMALIDTRTA